MKLPKVYEPALFEADIYALWEKANAFTPTGKGKSYSVVMPPPNANGNIHIGTAMTIGLEDIITRYHRLRGDDTLFLPGADHAGFETQVVFEKQLAKEGKSRFDFTRGELYRQIWEFVALNRQNFEQQFRRLGAGLDWTRYTFTLDEKIVKRAYATFKKMWDEGLIYRGERLVNYCTFHRTGFADIEVVYEDSVTPLYYMKYGPFILATTRPETKFGDTAVAVHPDDKRYKEYIGKVITVEGVNGPFEVEVVADEMVDPDFGTGVVKITPAHSFDDWEVAQRHNLPAKRIINHDGTLNHLAGRFEGMTIIEARKAVVKALEEKGLLVKVDEQYRNRIGKCYKCGTVIEPMLMEQWFLNMQPLAAKAVEALKANEITFYPETKRDQLLHYLENLRDWNLSRQIAWGIPIPAFQNVDDSDDWVYDERVEQEFIEVNGKTYHRDPDVFDTWFSSSSWPYATLAYPDGADYQQFYPLSLMETGGEILYPWVSRMLMLGLYVTGKVPFTSVYIHGYVLAEDGAKMSKSLGNVINPIDVIDTYGSDALRMGLIASRAPAINRGYDPRKIEDARNFCNKLWNIARYIEGNASSKAPAATSPKPHTIADHWVLTALHDCVTAIAHDLDSYRFAEAYDRLYHFVWDDFADWYIEASKIALNPEILVYGLESILRVAHPFAPFVTETIWQTVNWQPDTLLATDSWPDPIPGETNASQAFKRIKEFVSEARSITNALGAHQKPRLLYKGALTEEEGNLLKRLGRVSEMSEGEQGIRLLSSDPQTTLWLDIDQETIERYIVKLADQQAAEARTVLRLEERLKNKEYVSKAPKSLVSETKQQLEAAQARLHSIEQDQGRFQA